MTEYYVYIWRYPDRTPFYVGIGNRARIAKKLRNRLCNRVVEKIERDGGKVVKELFQVECKERAKFIERSLILQIGRRDLGTGPLVNFTEGGDGVKTPSAEVREKMGAANRGRKRSPETCAKIGAAKKGQSIPQDQRDRQAAKMRGRVKSPETCARISQSKKGIAPTEKVKIAQMLYMKNRTPEQIAALYAERRRKFVIKKCLLAIHLGVLGA